MWYSVGCTRFSPPLQIWGVSLLCSCVLCRVLLRWINTYYLCAVCRVRALVVFQSCVVVLRYGYCLSVDISVICFIVFIQDTINIVLCYCVLI